MQETLNSKKQGDTAFRAKDFTTAIDCYSQVLALCLKSTKLFYVFTVRFSNSCGRECKIVVQLYRQKAEAILCV